MRTRALGSLDVAVVGVGCNNFGGRVDADGTKAVVDAALDAGATFFDTADVYGQGDSERLLGRALAGRRDEATIATKFGMRMDDGPPRQGGDPDWVRRACEDSLRRLGVDVIDLYQMHRPDDDVPIEETLGALDDLVTAGKVREIGCSNFDAAGLDGAASVARDRDVAAFVSVQNRYSVLTRDVERDGVLDACDRHGLGLLPYFPLESGLLTGKYLTGDGRLDPDVGGRLNSMSDESRDRFVSKQALAATVRLAGLASEHGRSLLDLAISWPLTRGAVSSVIAGATKPDQVRANAAAAGWEIDDETLAEVDRVVGAALGDGSSAP